MFGFIDNDRAYYSTPSVSSLIVKNPDLEQTGENSCAIGSIAGTISFGYLFNCGVEGGTVAGNDNVGGLVGQTLHNTARIYACYNAGTAVFGDMLAGGVLGGGTAASPELGEVESCFNTGTVTGTDTFGSVSENAVHMEHVYIWIRHVRTAIITEFPVRRNSSETDMRRLL